MQPDERDMEVNCHMKVTVPQPFSFEERERERKQRRQSAVHTESADLTSFRAKPVPASVMAVGLYEKIREDQLKKNEERKRCSMIMTLANEKPFGFETRKVNKKTKQEREEFIFHAKPIPWYCSVELLNRKKEA